MPDSFAFPVLSDARGDLLPIELSDVPFPVRRVFWVRGSSAGVGRGGHVAGCQELLVLTSGTAEIDYGPDPSAPRRVRLTAPGSGVLVADDDHVVYRLSGADASILVLASEPYAALESRSG
ncbi:MAG: hypothetical protein JWO46_319 [Nocardioidaceae bacterium]|nr:hypothetical protein [Nocardioidaceae bacterium]